MVLSQIEEQTDAQSKNLSSQLRFFTLSQCNNVNKIAEIVNIFITIGNYYSLVLKQSQEKLISLELFFFC
tara:strand:- start:1333 stop:1542 length:210 start_codon:yes stop_codon:yes gene_type:complete